MAATRLAIVDLEGGEQPLANEDGRYWVVQNGEIYNHLELRSELEKRRHRFSTLCDTEVLAHAYEEWGPGCLNRLNGDFAFALWDRHERELFLARDRFGVRPLFIAEVGGHLSFASEAKALLCHPAVRRELEPEGLIDVFTTWASSPQRSVFAGVRELPPAHYLRWRPDGCRQQRRWWDLDFTPSQRRVSRLPDSLGVPDTPTSSASDRASGAAAEELGALLEDSVRLRLRADVTVGAYVSGGLDSSLVAALARRHVLTPLICFGLGFADRRFDESRYQDLMAQRLGLDLTQIQVRDADIGQKLPQAVWLLERPTLRTSPVPLLSLSGAVAASGLKVVLTGEGADELFGGYEIFQENAVRRFWARNPQSDLRPLLLRRLYPHATRELARSGGFLRRFYAQGLTETGDALYSHAIRFANTSRCLRVFDPQVLAAIAPHRDPLAMLRARLPEGFAHFSPLAKAQYLEIATFLTGYLLHSQGDRMLMANSVEGRFPFLDHRVAEFAARLPDSFKLRGLQEKYLLRRAGADLLPKEVQSRKKQPYRAPVLRSLVGSGAPEYVEQLLQPSSIGAVGVFSPQAVTRLYQKATGSPCGLSETDEMALVGVLSTMLLHEQFIASPPPPKPVKPTRVVDANACEVGA